MAIRLFQNSDRVDSLGRPELWLYAHPKDEKLGKKMNSRPIFDVIVAWRQGGILSALMCIPFLPIARELPFLVKEVLYGSSGKEGSSKTVRDKETSWSADLPRISRWRV